MEAPGSLGPDSARADIPGWDSMGALMIIAEFDSRFGLELSPEESRTMRTIGELLAFLERHGRLAG
jgi:acyl carrier protein